jgi:hypothetical protein
MTLEEAKELAHKQADEFGVTMALPKDPVDPDGVVGSVLTPIAGP